MHTIEFKKVGYKHYGVLCDRILLEKQKLHVKFDDEHLVEGEVIIDFDRHGNETPFIAVDFHGKQPWINLIGMKARRV